MGKCNNYSKLTTIDLKNIADMHVYAHGMRACDIFPTFSSNQSIARFSECMAHKNKEKNKMRPRPSPPPLH